MTDQSPASAGVQVAAAQSRPAAEVDRALRFTLKHAEQHAGESYEAIKAWGGDVYTAICEQSGPRGGSFDDPDECSVRFDRMDASFNRLWRAFLLVSWLAVVLLVAALWGWLR